MVKLFSFLFFVLLFFVWPRRIPQDGDPRFFLNCINLYQGQLNLKQARLGVGLAMYVAQKETKNRHHLDREKKKTFPIQPNPLHSPPIDTTERRLKSFSQVTSLCSIIIRMYSTLLKTQQKAYI